MKHLLLYIKESSNSILNILNNLNDTNHIRLTTSEINDICKYYNLSDINISIELPRLNKSNKYISLDFIKSNNKGSGTNFMNDFCNWADKNNRILCLNPTDIYVGKNNLDRLINFYKRFGFVKNKITHKSKVKKEYIREQNG